VIQSLACNFRVRVDPAYFAQEMEDLKMLEKDRLLDLQDGEITVTPAGRLLVRRVCMVFDRYLRERRERATYSKVV
jgi:oxygen-independent coproporphyrinogen-3 oxidase